MLKYREHQAQQEKVESSSDEIRKKEEEHQAKYRAEREARRLAGRFRMRGGQRVKQVDINDGIPRVSVIIKGDVHGSVEAILDVLETYTSHDRCRLDIVHYGVGNVTEGDLELAKAFNAIIYAFSVELPQQAQKAAKEVTVKNYNVIYRLIDDLKEQLSSKLPTVEVEEQLGEANVLQSFIINEGRKEVPVAGCRCTKGVLKKNQRFRLLRDGEIIYDGSLESMRHLKNEVDSIKKDVECGLRLKDAKVLPEAGDTLQCYTTHMEAQQTDWDPGF